MGAYRFPRLLMVAVAIGVLLTCTQAWGMIWDKYKDCTEYGDITQQSLDRWADDPENPDNDDWLGDVACAPTATMNSFIYLQKHYSTVYGDLLAPQGQEIARARILALDYMGTTEADWTTTLGWVYGKYNYLEKYAKGKTVYHGQTTTGDWTGDQPRPTWVENVDPTWQFVFNELNRCQDVEIGIEWTGGGHALTVCGFRWDDRTNKGQIWYIDPDTGTCTPPTQGVEVSMTGNVLGFTYDNNDAKITLALAESVPEPGSLMVLGSGLIGLLGLRIRRRR
jgi:hypothetical protein